ncbi:MAG: Tab2/Atab2 family RNA-binding protein [Cyanophyceae cyanobacterium]
MGTIWELDFYSRPILDENNKKVWEVAICESPLEIGRSPDSLFRYSQFCSNKTVNSLWLREALEKAMAEAPTPPKKVRFFRRSMKNMITKACEDAGIAAVPSRRTYALNQWLAQRQEFYAQQPGYDPTAATAASVQYPTANAVPLPDAIRGDKQDQWAFVSLEAAAFSEMPEWNIAFGEAFPLAMMGVTNETRIPGLIIFSARAIPLAGWMSGLEMGFMRLEGGSRPQVILETGDSDSWILASVTNAQTRAEAEGFERAKRGHGVHFLAVQQSPNSEDFAGFWLLKGEGRDEC